MKCDFCGGALSLENEYCPHCGRPNPHARQHIEDMRRYEGEFERTKKYVYDKTKTYTQVVVRMIILAALVILSVGLYVLADNAYSLLRDRERNKSDKKFNEYSQILDGYLEEENFRAFVSFCEARNLEPYQGAYAAKYQRVIWISRYYVYLMDYLSDYAFPKSYTTQQQAKWVADEMEYFYQYLDQDPADYYMEVEDNPLVAQALDRMDKNIEQFLMVYCGFTGEEAHSMREMSSARRQLLLEEKLEGRLANEE